LIIKIESLIVFLMCSLYLSLVGNELRLDYGDWNGY